jgi:hypothetical protein
MKEVIYYYANIGDIRVGFTSDFTILHDENLKQAGMIKTERSKVATTQENSPFANNPAYEFVPYSVSKTLLTETGVITFSYLVINSDIVVCNPIYTAGEYQNMKLTITREVMKDNILNKLVKDSIMTGKITLRME